MSFRLIQGTCFLKLEFTFSSQKDSTSVLSQAESLLKHILSRGSSLEISQLFHLSLLEILLFAGLGPCPFLKAHVLYSTGPYTRDTEAIVTSGRHS